MDIIPIAGMIFSLLTILLIGGFILLFPIARRLGKFLEVRIEERMEWGTLPKEALDELRDVVGHLQQEVSRLSERQQFVERLIEGGGTGEVGGEHTLPRSGSEEGDAGGRAGGA